MPVVRSIAKKISNYRDADSIGAKLRRKRLGPLLAMIDEVYKENGHVDIIDIGGTKHYWKIVPDGFLENRKVHVTVVNLPRMPLPPDDEMFTFVAADACDLSNIPDKSFHIAHSNSVLEHVGDWARMVAFSTEVARVAEKYFVQTPNFWFPVEPHAMTPFFHWLPKPLRVWLVLRFSLGHWPKRDNIDAAVRTVESARLVNKRMLQELFKDSQIQTETLGLLPKSFVALRR